MAVKQVNVPSGTKPAREKVDMEHVQCLSDELPRELTSEQREKAIEFICCNVNAFSRSEFDLGRMHLVEHFIEISGSRPVQQALRRHPVAYFPQ